MLNKTKSRRTGLWKYGFSAPLFALMLILSSAAANSDNSVLNVNSNKPNPVLKAISGPEIPQSVDMKNTDKILPDAGIQSNITDINTLKSTPPEKDTKPDLSKFNKHLQRNLKYPASARENEITGYVMVNFNVRNNKITGTEITKYLQTDIENEVLRTFNLFKEPIELEDNTYSMAIIYNLVSEFQNESLPVVEVAGNNLLGTIVVNAYRKEAVKIENEKQDIAQTPQEKIMDFATVDVLPEYPGGMKGWGEYLQRNLKYPAEARKNGTLGRVILSFIVRKDGSITDIKVLRGIGDGADEEAVRVVKESPKWKPGMIKDKPVNVSYTMPVFFQMAKP